MDTPFSLEQSDLFESEVHLAEIGDIMAIAVEGTTRTVWSICRNLSSLAQMIILSHGRHMPVTCLSHVCPTELPSLLAVVPVAEALLRVRNGPQLLTCLIANMPDQLDSGEKPVINCVQMMSPSLLSPSLSSSVSPSLSLSLSIVLTSLLVNGESQDEVSLAGRCRTAALSSLLHLHPPSSPHAQALSLLHHKHPTLALSIALAAEERTSSGFDSSTSLRPGSNVGVSDLESGHVLTPPGTGVVTLLHNIIIAGDEETKTWFSQYMKLMQQKVQF